MVKGVEAPLRRGASMEEVSIISLDLAKHVFQAHGATADGAVVFRRKLSRGQLLKFIADQPACVVAMEACASADSVPRRSLIATVNVCAVCVLSCVPLVEAIWVQCSRGNDM